MPLLIAETSTEKQVIRFWNEVALVNPSSLPSCVCRHSEGFGTWWGKEGKWDFSIPGRVKPWVNLQQMAHPVWGPCGWSNLSVSHITEYTLFYRMLVSNSLPNIVSNGSVIHDVGKEESCSFDLASGNEMKLALQRTWVFTNGFKGWREVLCCVTPFSQ